MNKDADTKEEIFNNGEDVGDEPVFFNVCPAQTGRKNVNEEIAG